MSTAPTRIEVADPNAYRRKLDGLLAGRDPLAVMSETVPAVRAMVRDKPASAFRQRPFPGKWTPNEIVGHLGDAEWAMGYRTRTVLGDDRPRLTGYDQERWVAEQRHNEREPSELVELFAALRGANLAYWKRLTPAQLERVGLHSERGEESLGLMLRMLAGHDLSHLDQLRRYLAAVPA